MTDQLTANLSLSLDSTTIKDDKNWDLTATLTQVLQAIGTQIITTSHAAITIGDLASTDVGLCVLYNCDPTNYIEYGSTLNEWRLNPGEFAFARINPSKTIQAKANSASVKIEKYIVAK